MLEDEPVHRPRAAGGKLPVHRAVQLPHAGGAIDEIRAVGLGVDVGAVIGRIGGELPDDLLEQVFDRDQPFDLAILVHDEPEPLLGLLEVA